MPVSGTMNFVAPSGVVIRCPWATPPTNRYSRSSAMGRLYNYTISKIRRGNSLTRIAVRIVSSGQITMK